LGDLAIGQQVLKLLFLLPRDVVKSNAPCPARQVRLLTDLLQNLLLQVFIIRVAEEGGAGLVFGGSCALPSRLLVKIVRFFLN